MKTQSEFSGGYFMVRAPKQRMCEEEAKSWISLAWRRECWEYHRTVLRGLKGGHREDKVRLFKDAQRKNEA